MLSSLRSEFIDELRRRHKIMLPRMDDEAVSQIEYGRSFLINLATDFKEGGTVIIFCWCRNRPQDVDVIRVCYTIINGVFLGISDILVVIRNHIILVMLIRSHYIFYFWFDWSSGIHYVERLFLVLKQGRISLDESLAVTEQ